MIGDFSSTMGSSGAFRLLMVLYSIAMILQSLEWLHFSRRLVWRKGNPNWDFLVIGLRIVAAGVLIREGIFGGDEAGGRGTWAFLSALAIWLSLIFQFLQFQGPVNGGSDYLSFVISSATCLGLVGSAGGVLERLALGWVAAHLTLSYFIGGWVKIRNPDWRTGRALGDFLSQSIYGRVRELRLPSIALAFGAWGLLVFELGFPSIFYFKSLAPVFLLVGLLFHLVNVFSFGLTRFFWIWIAAYPALVYFLERA